MDPHKGSLVQFEAMETRLRDKHKLMESLKDVIATLKCSIAKRNAQLQRYERLLDAIQKNNAIPVGIEW